MATKGINNMNHEITSLVHPIVKHLVKLRQNTDYRYDHQSVIIEGIKTVKEVAQTHPIKTLVAYDGTFIPRGVKGKEVFIVNEAIMKKVSGMQTPEGILAEVEMPKPASLNGLRYLLVLDRVSDPGNVGTILRTALALGWEGVFIVNESCDPFNEKSLRASRGATFRLPIAFGTWKDVKKIVDENKLTPLVADLNGKDLSEIKPAKGIALVLSNEAHGPSEEAQKLCQKVTVPMPGKMESLNVSIAGGILMYALRK